MGQYASRKLSDNLVYICFKSTITHKNNSTLNSIQCTTAYQTFFSRSLVTPQNLLGGAWVQGVNCGCMKKIVVFYLCSVLYLILASVKSNLWVARREWTSPDPEPRHCQLRLVSAGLSISYIIFDVSDILNKRRGFIWFSSEDQVSSLMDVGDGLLG